MGNLNSLTGSNITIIKISLNKNNNFNVIRGFLKQNKTEHKIISDGDKLTIEIRENERLVDRIIKFSLENGYTIKEIKMRKYLLKTNIWN